MSENKLTKMVPIRYIAMTWIPLIVVFLLPSGSLFAIIKIALIFWTAITVLSSWRDHWTFEGYETLGAFVTQNTVLFAVILFFSLPSWVNTLLIIWMMIGFSTKFSQIKNANKISENLPELNNKGIQLLQQYLGQTSYLTDKRKLNLITDRINLEQWKTNMDYIFSGISPDMLPEHSSLLVEEKAKLLKKATPKLRKVLMGLKAAIYFPLSLKKENHAWFIAAYPDVLDFFYPSPDYTKKPFDDERKRVEMNKKVVDPIMDDFLQFIEEKYKDEIKKNDLGIDMYPDLKDYYKNTLGKKLLLSNKNNKIDDRQTNFKEKIDKLTNEIEMENKKALNLLKKNGDNKEMMSDLPEFTDPKIVIPQMCKRQQLLYLKLKNQGKSDVNCFRKILLSRFDNNLNPLKIKASDFDEVINKKGFTLSDLCKEIAKRENVGLKPAQFNYLYDLVDEYFKMGV